MDKYFISNPLGDRTTVRSSLILDHLQSKRASITDCSAIIHLPFVPLKTPIGRYRQRGTLVSYIRSNTLKILSFFDFLIFFRILCNRLTVNQNLAV